MSVVFTGPPARASRTMHDPILEAAVDVARAAAAEEADEPSDVGEHLGTSVESDRLVTHRFAATMRGYRGWHWDVVLSRAPRSRTATVCEVTLLPGSDALLAPAWLPWSQRLRPGDIGPGDVLPFAPDDPRLEPGYRPTGDPDSDRVAIEELALARARILSRSGRDEAAARWFAGAGGPTAPSALRAEASCDSCGFMVPLQGALGQVFAVCANEWSPRDGQVVALGFGCGAHSETDLKRRESAWQESAPVIDELHVDMDFEPSPEPATADEAASDVTAAGSEPAAELEAAPDPSDTPETDA